MLIYKILRDSEWSDLQTTGQSHGAPIDLADGYIHFSTANQLAETLAKHFAGVTGLMLLACDAETMTPDIRWEPSRGGDLFPHLYRALHMTDILWSRDIHLQGGTHQTGPLA